MALDVGMVPFRGTSIFLKACLAKTRRPTHPARAEGLIL